MEKFADVITLIARSSSPISRSSRIRDAALEVDEQPSVDQDGHGSSGAVADSRAARTSSANQRQAAAGGDQLPNLEAEMSLDLVVRSRRRTRRFALFLSPRRQRPC